MGFLAHQKQELIKELEHLPIEGFPSYLITPCAKVYSKKSSRYLTTYKADKGYIRVSICRNGVPYTKILHRLVANTFIENPENKREVNHIDGNKSNNHVSNLEWVTHAENMKHAKTTGLMRARKQKGGYKAVICTATDKVYPTVRIAAEQTGTNIRTLYGYLEGRNSHKTTLRYAST
jgi:hypothetical protein